MNRHYGIWLTLLVILMTSAMLIACAQPTPASKPTTPAPSPSPPTMPVPAPSPKPTPTPTPAPAWKPPEFIRLGVPSTAGAGYAAAVAMYSAIEKATGVKFPATAGALPASRFQLLNNGTVDFSWMTAGELFFLLKGAEDFAQVGPQSVRTMWDGGGLDQGLATRNDTGIKTVPDLKGKKVASYDTYPAAQVIMEGALAWGNLTWNDVNRVPVAGYAQGQDALLKGQVDAAIVSSTAAQAQEMAASTRGIYWIPYPNVTSGDKAAWARFQKIMPVYYPNRTTNAAGVSKDKPVDIWAYNYQVVCWDTTSNDMVYWIVKQMAENYNAYKSASPFVAKWTLDHALQPSIWFSPRHTGAIKYYKDAGRWTAEMERVQQQLLTMYPQTKTQKKGS
ncbi:MAG: TAXI family TRAP transporter solute-binding subunit [Chloroflexota bacterium]